VAIALVVHLFGAVTPVAADVPITVDDAFVVQAGSVGNNLLVLANDTVATAAEITALTAPAHGVAAIVGSGRRIGYSPDAGYSGIDTFQYTVTDPVDGDSTATVTVTVNARPVASDDPSSASCWYAPSHTFALPEDKTTPFIAGSTCNLLANDTDSDGTVVDWEIVTPPAHGEVTNELPAPIPGFSTDFSYTPDPDYFTLPGDAGGSWLSDSFTYRAIDDDGGRSAPATVVLWIAPVNDAPTFTPGALTVHGDEGRPYSAAWASAISAGPNEGYQSVHFQLSASPSNPAGLFAVAPAISATGVLSFSAAAGHHGTASFQVVAKDDGGLENYGSGSGQPTARDTSDPVTLTITIDANAAPVAVDDPATPGCNPVGAPFAGSFPIPEDWGQFVFGAGCSATANDRDADGSIVGWQIDTPPAHGTLEWLPDHPEVFGYTPDPDYSTPPGVYVSDSFTYHVVDDVGASSNVATYRFWIAPVNDAPSFTPGLSSVAAPAGIAYNQPWATAIKAGPANESGQAVHFEITNVDLHGMVGLFDVAPAIAANGRLTFTGHGRGLATVTVVAKDDGGLESYSGVDIHPEDTSAPVSFDIVVGDAAPVAVNDTVTVTEDQPGSTTVAVLANDSDADGDPLTVTARTNGAKGVATITNGGTTVAYRPNANAFGKDTFTYTVSDGQGGLATGTVTVTINAVNDPPNAANDGVPTPATVYLKGLPKAIPVLANDTSAPDGAETLKIVAVTQGGHGAVAITGGGTGLTYQATGTATGIDVFTYTISDGHGGTDKASVQVNVVKDTSAPKATITGIAKSSVAGKPSSIRLTVTWTLSDTGTGVRSQQLQRRTGTGSWVNVTLSSASTRKAAFILPRHHTYSFRVRATDRAGNVGIFAAKSVAT
jgi:hypothetical protein